MSHRFLLVIYTPANADDDSRVQAATAQLKDADPSAQALQVHPSTWLVQTSASLPVDLVLTVIRGSLPQRPFSAIEIDPGRYRSFDLPHVQRFLELFSRKTNAERARELVGSGEEAPEGGPSGVTDVNLKVEP